MTPLLLLAALAATEAPVEGARSLVTRLQPVVEEIRGLKFKRPVAVRIESPAAARVHFAERAKSLWPEERARLDQKVYEQLGLLPAGFDLLGSVLDLLEEQALGYYDPGSDEFTMVEGQETSPLAPMLVAHELTHALDDQHFDLDALLRSSGDDDDRNAAVAAVVEGSGTAVMTLFLTREVGAGRISLAAVAELQKSEAQRALRLKAAPAVIQRGLLASYVLGMSFLLRGNPGRILGGVPGSDLDRAFTDPPRTTEQILHPEKYWEVAARDASPLLSLPDLSSALGKGFSLRGRGNLGELELASLAGVAPVAVESPDVVWPARWTNAAASGTAGDAFQHYADAARGITLLATRWDTDGDAVEFQDGLTTVPRGRSYRAGRGVVILAGDDLGPQAERVAATVLEYLASSE